MAENFLDASFYNFSSGDGFEMENNLIPDEDIATVYKVIRNFDSLSIIEIKESFFKLIDRHRSEFSVRNIPEGQMYYRARLGCNKEKGSIGKKNLDVLTPFFGDQMEIPPTSFAKKGRFNRDGVAFLYLSSNIETCVSELKLDVGQLCSVCRFVCCSSNLYLDLTQEDKSSFAAVIKRVLLNPVYPENKNYYLLTESLSSVIRRLGFRGICYPSTQSADGENFNIVCFYPKDYSFVEYSDSLFKVQSVKYAIEKVPESYRSYEGYEHLLSTVNDSEESRKQKIFNYIERKTAFEKGQ